MLIMRDYHDTIHIRVVRVSQLRSCVIGMEAGLCLTADTRHFSRLGLRGKWLRYGL